MMTHLGLSSTRQGCDVDGFCIAPLITYVLPHRHGDVLKQHVLNRAIVTQLYGQAAVRVYDVDVLEDQVAEICNALCANLPQWHSQADLLGTRAIVLGWGCAQTTSWAVESWISMHLVRKASLLIQAATYT